MPVLNWIGTEAVLNHHNDLSYRLLRCDGEHLVDEADSDSFAARGR